MEVHRKFELMLAPLPSLRGGSPASGRLHFYQVAIE